MTAIQRHPESKVSHIVAPDTAIAMTEMEYVEREKTTTERSEYHDGKAMPMVGGTEDHATLIIAVGSLLRTALRGKGCRVGTDQRIRAGNRRYYPDVVVTCGERVFDGFDVTTLLTPTVLVEVLSTSTEATDRGDKLRRYRTLESLQSYVLVTQYFPQVELYERNAAGGWIYTFYMTETNTIDLPAIGCRLALADIYEDLDIWDNAPGDSDAPPETVSKP